MTEDPLEGYEIGSRTVTEVVNDGEEVPLRDGSSLFVSCSPSPEALEGSPTRRPRWTRPSSEINPTNTGTRSCRVPGV